MRDERIETPAEDLPPLVLLRVKINLTLLLPVGSEPGDYEVRLLGPDGQVLVSTSGRAEIREFVTRLQVTLDLRAVAPGGHRLVLGPANEEKSTFEVEVR